MLNSFYVYTTIQQASKSYSDTCGMTDLGIDADYEGLRYFEMTPEQAAAFIAKGNRP